MSGDNNNNNDDLDGDKAKALAENGAGLERNAFFDANMPADVSDAVLEQAQYRATMVNRYGGEVANWSLGGSGGSITAILAEEIKKEKEATDDFQSAMDSASEIHRAMTQTEWEHTRFDFAGMDMDGAEIDSLMSYMKDPSVRQRLIEKRAKEKGITTEQAEKEHDAAVRYGELFEKVKRGMATEAEKAEFQTLDTPQTREVLQSAENVRTTSFAPPQTPETSASRNSTSESEAMHSRDERFARPFPSAPNATGSFVQAKLATEPLDVPRAPVQVASLTVQPAQQARAMEESGFGV